MDEQTNHLRHILLKPTTVIRWEQENTCWQNHMPADMKQITYRENF